MKAINTLNKISDNDILWKKQLDREVALTDYNSGIANAHRKGFSEGVAKGVANTKTQTAISLKEQQIPLEIISKATGLSIEQIENL